MARAEGIERLRYDVQARDFLEPGGPRILPVSGKVAHGSERSRSEEFDQAVQAASELGTWHALLGYRDRRFDGRRYRPTWNGDGPQDPYPPGLAPAEMPVERFQRGW